MAQELKNKILQAQEHERQGNLGAAEAAYLEILSLEPKHALAMHSLGVLYFHSSQWDRAFDYFARAVQEDPTDALYQRNLGELCRRLGKVDQAVLFGIAATKLDAKNAEPFYNLALAYTDSGQIDKAISAYRKAVKLNPKHGLAWNNLGSALEHKGNKKSALTAYEHAVEIHSGHAEAQNNQGAIYTEMGRLDEARTSFNAAIATSPDFVEAHYNLSSLKTYTKDDPHLAILEQIYAQRSSLPESARIRYAFALGKALDDIGRYDDAFKAYQEGNRLQHARLPVDESSADELLKAIINVFTPEFFAQRKQWVGAVDSKRVPIFIVGMPRSGTTLLEQILSTHRSVYGAGELTDLNAVIYEATGQKDNNPFANNIVSLSEEQVRRIGEDYLTRVWKLAPKSIFITDKMPANFFYLGLIHLALPNAKIIHAMRDPMDSCFSCYSRLFNDTMEFAYDLDSLGNYYRRYITLMKHWHAVLPANTILDLSYEDLVADTEKEARRVLEFVGLPWDENCLEFHKNDRLVKTASVAQVRKPIYKSSLARWKHFKGHLQPLLKHVQAFRNSQGDDVTVPSSELIRSPLMVADAQLIQKLIEQSVQLQGQNQHQAVIDQLIDEIPRWENDSNLPVLLHLLGISFYRLNRFDEARSAYERALQIQPNFPSALNSLGFLLQDIGLIEQAKTAFERALQLAPELAMARLNLGMAQLKLGDFENGLENYEARWTGSAESAQGTFTKPECPLPLWNGEENTQEQSLLIITEQGFGDTFQYSRYLLEVTKRFKKVGFACSAPTLRLMEWAFNHRVTLFTHLPKDYGTWDYQCALMSLPRLCKTRLESIPQEVPYLQVPPAILNHWQEKLLAASPKRLKVGIAWAGRAVHQYDSRRSLQFAQILPLLQVPFITWVSLQKWMPQDVRPTIPENVDWIDWTDDLQDFGDTAALVQNLDLVISIDSSMVHLAGALNKPVWMLNRFDGEWRWLNQRSDSPWYPSMRIFNQPSFGDWQSVIAEATYQLQQLPRSEDAAVLRDQPAVQPRSLGGKTPVDTPQNTLTIEQALQLANQLQVSGRLGESERVLKEILQIDPKQAHALHLLGVVTYQAGQTVLALDLLRQAIALQPDTALFESNLAEMSRQQGRIAEAIEHGKRSIVIDPTMPSAHSNLGIALFDAGLYEEAEECHAQALALAPHLLQSLNNMGSIERVRQNSTKALEWYRKALSVNPAYLEALTNIGAVLLEVDRPEEAIEPLVKVLNISANSPEALCNLGLAYYKLNDFDKAISLLQRSLEYRPGYSEAVVGLSQVLLDSGNIAQAEQILSQAVQHMSSSSNAWSLLGAIYTEQAKSDLAENAYRKALEIDAQHPDALTGLANLSLESGDIGASESLLLNALQQDPQHLGARFHLVQIKKIKPGDSNLVALEAILADKDHLSVDKQISLHYALGKAYDDLEQFDRAFEHFSEGSKLKRKKVHYSAEADSLRTQKIIDIYTPDFYSKLQGVGNGSDVPIFIVGMPRSGTTLIEQIVSSHPQVYGAGELSDFLDLYPSLQAIHAQQSDGRSDYPTHLERLDKHALTQWGSLYVDGLKRFGGSNHVTDKMPGNYMALGLIRLALPNARIIHIKRNPIDTCLSCYTRLFNRHQNASYDLVELGRHYLNYARIMEHWKLVLPQNSIIEVQYENLIGNTEFETRRLIQSLGLDWNEACLSFHQNKRSVRTASLTQVREPIYKSSQGRWHHYEKHLAPLLHELKTLL